MSDDPTAAAIIDARERERMAEARYETLLARWREAQAEIADLKKRLVEAEGCRGRVDYVKTRDGPSAASSEPLRGHLE